jgi:hypothetical protein
MKSGATESRRKREEYTRNGQRRGQGGKWSMVLSGEQMGEQRQKHWGEESGGWWGLRDQGESRAEKYRRATQTA